MTIFLHFLYLFTGMSILPTLWIPFFYALLFLHSKSCDVVFLFVPYTTNLVLFLPRKELAKTRSQISPFIYFHSHWWYSAKTTRCCPSAVGLWTNLIPKGIMKTGFKSGLQQCHLKKILNFMLCVRSKYINACAALLSVEFFHRTPAGCTAERKTRRKRNMGCHELLSIPCYPSPPLSNFPPPHTAQLSHRLRPHYQD